MFCIIGKLGTIKKKKRSMKAVKCQEGISGSNKRLGLFNELVLCRHSSLAKKSQ